ncbi:MAG: FMN-binding protein, partial [Frankiales bacterium]|nr:FMN-binding protein [Frankiales bacterium]
MKRVIMSIVGTGLGLVALLSFKSQNQVTVGAHLPSAALGTTSGGASSTTPPKSTGSAPASNAPASSAPTGSAPTGSAPASKTYDG